MIYREVFKELNKRKVKYVVVGGIAVVVYGVVRFTADLDLVISLGEKNIDRFFNAVEKLGYKAKIPVKKKDFKDKKVRQIWARKKNMIVFSFYHSKDPLKIIDVFIKQPIRFELLYKNALRIKIKGITIPFASIRDLKRLKKKTARPQDLIDIENLKAIEKIKKKDEKRKS